MMRLLYFVLFLTLPISTRIYFRRRKTINSPKSFYGRTIYVSNHAASFMDPLLVASMRKPIVFFMTRADIFSPFLKPIAWAAHMLPIYRQQDGEGNNSKNEAVFKTCAKILAFGRNLLIFGEGFTDDVFIRRLKPVKKGAVRIGFIALEQSNWKNKIYVAAVGCNYTDPNFLRGDILLSTSDKICLNDYQEAFKVNPNKVINELTKKVELLMREQITHVEDINWAPFHENVMQLTRKGMNSQNFDRKISLEKRWRYSQNLANWMNASSLDENPEILALKSDVEGYFSLLKKMKLKEENIYDAQSKAKGSRFKELLFLLTLWPFAIIGFVHCFIPYFFIKKFTEKSFKRRVFWSSVKMLLGMLSMAILNFPFIFVFYNVIYPSYTLALINYLFFTPACGLVAYLYVRNIKNYQTKGVLAKMNLTKFIAKREALILKIKELIPVA